MDRNIYSEKTTFTFIQDTVCLKDKLLKEYFYNNKISLFRKRWAKMGSEKELSKIIQTLVTDTLRGLIYELINNLSSNLYKYWGNLIVSGGEAFNMQVNMSDRMVTSDIDTKFIPFFQGIKSTDRKYFQYLQLLKLHMWNLLGEICYVSHKNFKYIYKNYLQHLEKSQVGKIFGIKFDNNKVFLRRYSVLPKKNFNNKNKSKPLIDVELFALDVSLRCFQLKNKKPILKSFTVPGLLDIPILREGEFGYVGSKDYTRGVRYANKKFKNVLTVSKEYMIHDIYDMKRLGLRPEKIEKDKQRFKILLKKIGIKDVDNKSNNQLFRIGMKKIKKKKRIPINRKNRITKLLASSILKTNSLKYKKYTNPMIKNKLAYLLGFVKSPVKFNKSLKKILSNYVYNTTTLKWKPASKFYISNKSNYRTGKSSNNKVTNNKLKNISEYIQNHPLITNIGMMLYGFSPKRNHDIKPELILKILIMMTEGYPELERVLTERLSD